MPIELFATDALREKRMAALRAENGEYEFDTFDTVVVTEDAEAVAPDASKEEDERKITDFFADLLAGN
jgi:hypothetical protein